MELGRFYIKEKETNKVYEILLTDGKYINTEEVSFWFLFKRMMKTLFVMYRHKNILPRENISEAIMVNSKDIFEAQNKILLDNKLPIINYVESDFFNNPTNEKPNYFG